MTVTDPTPATRSFNFGNHSYDYTSNGDGFGTLNLTVDATLKTTMIMSQLVNMKKLSDPPLFYAFCSTERTPSLAQSSTSKSMPSINYHSVNYQTLAVIAGISNSVGVFTF